MNASNRFSCVHSHVMHFSFCVFVLYRLCHFIALENRFMYCDPSSSYRYDILIFCSFFLLRNKEPVGRRWSATNATDVLCCISTSLSATSPGATTTATFHDGTTSSIFEFCPVAISNWLLSTASISAANIP